MKHSIHNRKNLTSYAYSAAARPHPAVISIEYNMNNIVIIRDDGTSTLPMDQAQAEIYLGNLLINAHKYYRLIGLSQALNDVVKGQGKPTNGYKFYHPSAQDAQPVLHVSATVNTAAGKPGSRSVCLFFYTQNQGNHVIFAVGEHASKTSCTLIDHGQPATGPNKAFKKQATITLSGKAERASSDD